MESEFVLVKKPFNHEKDVSMKIELNKTCFSLGETIIGTITLTPKENSNITKLLDANAIFTFEEKQNYTILESHFDKDTDTIKPFQRNINEILILGTTTMNFSKFLNANMVPNLKIPFKIQTPQYAYPSCLFGDNAYVIHFLICEFKSLKVKKSVIIIIKNSPYFNNENKLLKIPAVYEETLTKHKIFLLSCGNFKINVKLEKNICPYNENLPIMIDINCNELKEMRLKNIKIYLFRKIRKNSKKDTKKIVEEKIEEIVRKTLTLRKGEKVYHIKDEIKLPISSNDSNPEEVYKILDKDKSEDNKKFFDVRLYPSCYGGLLSCNYYIKITMEISSMLSPDEEMKIIPIDFYSPFNEKKKENFNMENDINNIENENINININNDLKIKKEENIFKEKINFDKLEPKSNLIDNDENIDKNIKNDSNTEIEEEKKDDNQEDKKDDEDDDDNVNEGFDVLGKYSKQ